VTRRPATSSVRPPETHEVHAWRASIAGSAAATEGARRLLSADEQARADRFHQDADRSRYVMARAHLRDLLGEYLGEDPARIRLNYDPYGKPSLAHPAASLQFNVSHSDAIALYAFATCRRVGIDVERIRPEAARDGIAEAFFAPTERAQLRALAPTLQVRAFFECWTRKEAFLKALGRGLSLPLSAFTVSVGPDSPASLLHVAWDPAEASRWSISDLDAGPVFAAAVAVEGDRVDLIYREWPSSPPEAPAG
jgi:4'-phosphopantetheinyl transferase